MSGSREKDSSDFDLEQFVDLFDTAMSSDNPAVKRALKNLLMIASLVDSDIPAEQRVEGPLRRLVDDINNLSRRIGQLEQEKNFTRTYGPSGAGGGGIYTTPYKPDYQIPPSIGTGTTPWPPGTIIGQGGIGGVSGSYTLTNMTSTTAFDDQYKVDIDEMLNAKYAEVLNKLEQK